MSGLVARWIDNDFFVWCEVCSTMVHVDSYDKMEELFVKHRVDCHFNLSIERQKVDGVFI